MDNTFANLIFVSGMERSGFPETPILLGLGKSYLIPFTPNFDIGEGIDGAVNCFIGIQTKIIWIMHSSKSKGLDSNASKSKGLDSNASKSKGLDSNAR